MAEQKVRCMRCYGRKKIYKIMGGYSHANTGGKEVDCPMCLGEGKILKLEDALRKVEQMKPEKRDAENGKRKAGSKKEK